MMNYPKINVGQENFIPSIAPVGQAKPDPKWVTPLKVTSWLTVAASVWCTLACLGITFCARHVTDKIFKFAHKDLPEADTLSKAYFVVFDCVRNCGIIGVFFGLVLLSIGITGLKVLKMAAENAQYRCCAFKCTVFRLFILAGLYFACKHAARDAHTVLGLAPQIAPPTVSSFVVADQQFKDEEVEDDDDTAVDCRGTYKDQTSCDANAACSWCVSAAVKPACNTLEDAKSLPPSVFKCDKISAEKPSAKQVFDTVHKKRHICPFMLGSAILLVVHVTILYKFKASLETPVATQTVIVHNSETPAMNINYSFSEEPESNRSAGSLIAKETNNMQ